jgi:hypothetical protein
MLLGKDHIANMDLMHINVVQSCLMAKFVIDYNIRIVVLICGVAIGCLVIVAHFLITARMLVILLERNGFQNLAILLRKINCNFCKNSRDFNDTKI